MYLFMLQICQWVVVSVSGDGAFLQQFLIHFLFLIFIFIEKLLSKSSVPTENPQKLRLTDNPENYFFPTSPKSSFALIYSYINIPAATEAFKLSVLPSIGIFTLLSAIS